MPRSEAVLRVNALFYTAFSDGDFQAMDGLWARRAAVACAHPGWPPLIGREAVMASWRDLLTRGEPIRAHAVNPRVLPQGDAALVLCGESINGQAVLTAANLFIIEDGDWRMTFHQAGRVITTMAEASESAPPARHLH